MRVDVCVRQTQWEKTQYFDGDHNRYKGHRGTTQTQGNLIHQVRPWERKEGQKAPNWNPLSSGNLRFCRRSGEAARLIVTRDSMERGVTVARCLEFGREVARRHAIPFLYMTYYNILYRHGVEAFVEDMAASGIQGAIVPDLPPEEADDSVSFAEA